MQRYAVLMAGGSGTRLWPLSKEASPKQFIPVEGDSSMLVQTIKRLCRVVQPEHCFIVTNCILADITKETAGKLIPEKNIILEPERKNTAACIAYSTLALKKKLGAGILCFVPADGYVKDTSGYAQALRMAFDTAEKVGGLVIIGVKPAYPATGYGYIHVEPVKVEGSAGVGPEAIKDPVQCKQSAAVEGPAPGAESAAGTCVLPGEESDSFDDSDISCKNVDISRVLEFIEKPALETAQKLAASDDYLWNCGIVVGSMESIIQKIKENIPEHYHKLSSALESGENDEGGLVGKAYGELQSISFDNAVLERCADSLYAVRASFDWDDIGSIDALAMTLEPDSDGNLVKGRHIGINTTNSVIYGKDAAICTIDIDNMIVVGTKDEVLVCPRSKSQKVKLLVEKLKEQGHDDLL
mgnify:FL=1